MGARTHVVERASCHWNRRKGKSTCRDAGEEWWQEGEGAPWGGFSSVREGEQGHPLSNGAEIKFRGAM